MGSLLSSALPVGSIRGATFNIASATLGAGALSLPYAFKCSGVLLGSILLTVAALATVYSIRLLLTASRVASARYRRIVDSYEDLAGCVFGSCMRHIIEVMVILFCFGTAIGYCIAVGDILEPIRLLDGMPAMLSGDYGRVLLMLLFWCTLMLPLSLLRSVSSLQYSSFLGVAAIVFLVFATLFHCISNRFIEHWDCSGTLGHGKTCSEPMAVVRLDGGTLTSAPLIMFAFTCQMNIYDVYRELSNPSEAKMMRVSWMGMCGICLLVYAAMGLFGYLDFLDIVQGNILINLQYDVGRSIIITFAFLAITLTVVAAFPLVVFPCRESIFSILRSPSSAVERDYMIEQHRLGVAEGCFVVGPGARRTSSVPPTPQNPWGRQISSQSIGSSSPCGAGLSSQSPTSHRGDLLDEPLLRDSRSDSPPLVLPILDVGAEGYYVPPVPTRVYTRPPAWQHYVVSMCISIGAIVVAIFVPKIQIVFSLLGGCCSSFLCFVFPAMTVKRLGCCSAETVGKSGIIAIELLQWVGGAAGVFSTGYTLYGLLNS